MADSGGIKKILLFIEGSEASMRAAQYAVALAKMLDAALTVLYVVDVKTLDDLLKARIFVRMEEMDYERDLEEDGRRYLDHVRDLAEARGVSIAPILEKGEVHSVVCARARELGADLLVMAELEMPQSRRDFYYDERERVFREVRCPVLVVKGDEEIQSLYDSV